MHVIDKIDKVLDAVKEMLQPAKKIMEVVEDVKSDDSSESSGKTD